MIAAAKTDVYFSSARMLTQQYDISGRKLLSSQKIVLDSIRQTDPGKADALKKNLADAGQVIAQLRSGKSKAAQSRKAAAVEKIKRIKEEIKMLMAMGGDPKMIARQIARLSKDLAAAAREYASAGRASSPDNAAAAGASNGNTISTAAQNDGTAGATVSLTASAENVSGVLVVFGERGETGKSDAPESTALAQIDVLQEKNTQQDQDALRQRMKTDLQNKAAELSSKTSAAEADRQFSREVRALAALLKLLARQQKQRLQQAGEHSADREMVQTSQALAEAEKSVSGTCAPGINVAAMTVTV